MTDLFNTFEDIVRTQADPVAQVAVAPVDDPLAALHSLNAKWARERQALHEYCQRIDPETGRIAPIPEHQLAAMHFGPEEGHLVRRYLAGEGEAR